MKKLLALLLSLILALSATALAEVVVISSPDMAEPEYDGQLGEVKIGKAIDLGDRLYLPTDGRVLDVIHCVGFHIGESKTSDLLTLTVEATNFATSKQIFFNDVRVTATYTNSRGEYVFQGDVRQRRPEDSFWSGSPQYRYASDSFVGIDPLDVGYYIFYCAMPNYVFETEGKIVMNIEMGDQTMTWVYREK